MVFFLFFLTASKAFAEIKIKAEVDKASIATDETIIYKLAVSSSEKNLPEPKFPEFTGFKIVSSLRSSNISFAQGSMRSVTAYSFVLAPATEGRFKISPSRIDFKNKVYESESFEIDVKMGSNPIDRGFRPEKPDAEAPIGQQELPEYTL